MFLDYEKAELSVSGSELPYNPKVWNRPDTKRKINCFAYAMGLMDFSQLGMDIGLSLGEFSGEKCDLRKGIFEVKRALYCDMEKMGRKIKRVGIEEKCPDGMYKIAVYAAPAHKVKGYYEPPKGAIGEYHFYRQNPPDENNCITWSHKYRFIGRVSNKDAEGKVILNPQEASRDYSKQAFGFNYSIFIGCFAVSAPSEDIVEQNRVGIKQKLRGTF